MIRVIFNDFNVKVKYHWGFSFSSEFPIRFKRIYFTPSNWGFCSQILLKLSCCTPMLAIVAIIWLHVKFIMYLWRRSLYTSEFVIDAMCVSDCKHRDLHIFLYIRWIKPESIQLYFAKPYFREVNVVESKIKPSKLSHICLRGMKLNNFRFLTSNIHGKICKYSKKWSVYFLFLFFDVKPWMLWLLCMQHGLVS